MTKAPEKIFLVSLVMEESHLRRLLSSLDEAASACDTMAEESSANDLKDAADAWEWDAKNLRTLIDEIEKAKRSPCE
jgi:hypothetical protein